MLATLCTAYPELYTSVSQFLLSEKQIWQPVDAKLQLIDFENLGIRQPAVAIYCHHGQNKEEFDDKYV